MSFVRTSGGSTLPSEEERMPQRKGTPARKKYTPHTEKGEPLDIIAIYNLPGIT